MLKEFTFQNQVVGPHGERHIFSQTHNGNTNGTINTIYLLILKILASKKMIRSDIAHCHKIVISFSETIRLIAEIDEVTETHGGWPGAFAGAKE